MSPQYVIEGLDVKKLSLCTCLLRVQQTLAQACEEISSNGCGGSNLTTTFQRPVNSGLDQDLLIPEAACQMLPLTQLCASLCSSHSPVSWHSTCLPPTVSFSCMVPSSFPKKQQWRQVGRQKWAHPTNLLPASAGLMDGLELCELNCI